MTLHTFFKINIYEKDGYFFGAACIVVALASAAFTKANAKFTDPEYDLTINGACADFPFLSECVQENPDCYKTVNVK